MSANWLVAVLMLGCGDAITAKNLGEGDDSGVDEDGGPPDLQGDDTDADGGTQQGQSPSVSYAQAFCEAAPSRTWNFVATASDPQGIDSLGVSGTVDVYSGEDWVSQHALTLDTASQRYLASVSVADVAVPCSRAAEHDFSFTVADEDGNVSEPKIVSGETE